VSLLGVTFRISLVSCLQAACIFTGVGLQVLAIVAGVQRDVNGVCSKARPYRQRTLQCAMHDIMDLNAFSNACMTVTMVLCDHIISKKLHAVDVS